MTKTVSALPRDPANAEADGAGNWRKLFLMCTCVFITNENSFRGFAVTIMTSRNEYTTRQLCVSSLAVFYTLLADILKCSAPFRKYLWNTNIPGCLSQLHRSLD